MLAVRRNHRPREQYVSVSAFLLVVDGASHSCTPIAGELGVTCCPIGALLSGMCKHRQCQTFTQRCPRTSGPPDKGLDQNRWVEKLDVGQAIDTEKRSVPLFELEIFPKRVVWSLSLNELNFVFDTSSWGENKTTDKSHWALFDFAWRLIAGCLKAGFRNLTSDTTEHDILFRHMLLLTNSSEWPSSGRSFFGNSPA